MLHSLLFALISLASLQLSCSSPISEARELYTELAEDYNDDYSQAPKDLQDKLLNASQAIFHGTGLNGKPDSTMGTNEKPSDDNKLALKIRRFNEASVEGLGAVCMDGSSYAYYIRNAPANSSNPNAYLIYLQGGSLCVDETSCTERSRSTLGSSKNYGEYYVDDTGAFDLEPFSDWNWVMMPYCSGDVWGGSRTTNSSESWGFYFAGHNITQAVIQDLKSTLSINATDIVVTGESAGGIGTILHVDNFADAFPHATVVGMPQAGWFTAAMTYPQWTVLADSDDESTADRPSYTTSLFRPLIPMYDVYQWVVSEECAERHNQSINVTTFCTSMPELYKYVKSPMFIVENRFDVFELVYINLVPVKSVKKTIDYVLYFGDAMKRSISSAVEKKGSIDGYFVPPCVQHPTYLKKMPGYDATIRGEYAGEVFNGWWQSLKAGSLTESNVDEYRAVSSSRLPSLSCSITKPLIQLLPQD